MSGFSPKWLDLREPVDARSRSAKLATTVARHFDGWRPVSVVDLGCGTGANLRATVPNLGPEQHWTLVDHDPILLDAARERLAVWADGADRRPNGLALFKGSKRVNVEFRCADIAGDLQGALGPSVNLVTASAFFDLVSRRFIALFAAAVAKRRSAFYTVLTYDGDQRWTPERDADAAMLEAFHAHQRRDKGFGAAAGPDAPELLSEAFLAAGYSVMEADSAWRLGSGDRELIGQLGQGFTTAIGETGLVDAAMISRWSAATHTAAIIGHADTLALPPA
jgi:SAM-dependent methyltransferase